MAQRLCNKDNTAQISHIFIAKSPSLDINLIISYMFPHYPTSVSVE